MNLPESVIETLPDQVAFTIVNTVLHSCLDIGKSELSSYITAYKALEEAGYEQEEGIWIAKDATVGDVHVNKPIGAIQFGRKKKKKDDPGTENVDSEESSDLSTDLPTTNDSDDTVVKRISGNSSIPLSGQ